ncbi:MAG: hypothetical protein AAGE52_17005 [Myxococcota bacterium]
MRASLCIAVLLFHPACEDTAMPPPSSTLQPRQTMPGLGISLQLPPGTRTGPFGGWVVDGSTRWVMRLSRSTFQAPVQGASTILGERLQLDNLGATLRTDSQGQMLLSARRGAEELMVWVQPRGVSAADLRTSLQTIRWEGDYEAMTYVGVNLPPTEGLNRPVELGPSLHYLGPNGILVMIQSATPTPDFENECADALHEAAEGLHLGEVNRWTEGATQGCEARGTSSRHHVYSGLLELEPGFPVRVYGEGRADSPWQTRFPQLLRTLHRTR